VAEYAHLYFLKIHTSMNYTKPNEPDYEDDPLDWLNSALTFASALGLILKEMEGVIVDVKGDMNFKHLSDCKKVIVFREDEQIHIVSADREIDAPEGTLVWMHPKISEN
jgi:hypothetical protein